ncbi:MAG: phosphatidylserine/phosphatidylglycerophosphate/cardiolipin synthase family protein [Vicinamibacteria bacterium]|nr:phosphatidylserine/phosphatidylglycerophosphate/cardiolipin synthase family protein [Vicinamibacteria bacterium]
MCAAIDQAQARVWVAVTFLWADFQMPDGRGSFFEVLTRARRRGLDVRVIFWRPDEASAELRTNAFWGSPEHRALLKQEASDVSIRWDRAQAGFCQHQKFWVLDAGLDAGCAFVGGINLNPHSVVAPGHRGAEQNHDIYVEVSGPAVTDIHHNFVQRWNEASERQETDGRWGPDADRDLGFPTEVAAARGSAVVQLQRTIQAGRYTDTHPVPGGAPFAIAGGEFSNRDQYIQAIRAARECIYLENQAISVQPILDELVGAIGRGVAVVLVAPPTASSTDQPADGRTGLFRDERRALARSPLFTLAGLAGLDLNGSRQPVHVHSKLMIVDDVWATVGSCNLHRYSMDGNSELNVAFTDAMAVRSLRCELLAEHLGRDTSTLDGGSALRVFRAVAQENAARRDRGDSNWEGLAHALDPLQYWPL